MVLRIADNCHATAVGSYHGALRNRLFGVVGAFRMNVGLQSQQELLDSRFVEDCDVSYRFERGNDLGAFRGGHDRPARAFESYDLCVGVNAHYEHVSQLACACEISHVSDMKHVETTVREDDSRT